MNWGYRLGGNSFLIYMREMPNRVKQWELHGMSQETHGTIVRVPLLKRKIIERKWKFSDVIWNLMEPHDVIWESGLPAATF